MAQPEDRHRGMSVPDEYPESMACSVSTVSSRPASPAISTKSPSFDPAVYDHDQVPDHVEIMSHSRQASLDFQYNDPATKELDTKALPRLSTGRPQSLGLPVRVRQDSPTEKPRTLKRATTLSDRASSVRPRPCDARVFDLMAPPPGRRRSGLTKTNSFKDLRHPSPVDANPSEALTSRIAASILQEGYGVQAANSSVPLKVQDAVDRCLQEVSTTVGDEHPQWALPTYYSRRLRSSTRSSYSDDSSDYTRSSNQEKVPNQSSGCGDVPYLYDQILGRLERQDSGHRDPSKKKRARCSDELHGFPCPFRRRNPVGFNIRDQEHCAKRPFSDIQELKRHIRTYHRKLRSPYYCPRCKKGFLNEDDMSEHLMVPVDQMCEAKPASSDSADEDGITDEMDRILADTTSRKGVRTWEEIWKLLFPRDTAVLDPDFQPAVEMVEMEQELDDSQAELKADLSESLKRLLPDQPEDVCFFLAGQFQLVFEQHRAKVNRRCRHNSGSSSTRSSTIEKHRSQPSRFSIRNIEGITSRNYTAQGGNQQFSPMLHRQRFSQPPPWAPRTNVVPASSSSVYSTSSNVSTSSNSRPMTRSSTLSSVGIQVESPRLPFKDWVQGIKFNNSNGDSQRDSGLAVDQCEVCKTDPCQCESYAGYADQLSAFMTPAVAQASSLLVPYATADQGADESETDWAAQYGDKGLSTGMPLSAVAVEVNGA